MRLNAGKKLTPALGALLLLVRAAPALAQIGAPASPQVTFASVSGIPLQSVSGRFHSLAPPNRLNCRYSTVTGRVVSTRLIMADEMSCGQAETRNVLVNVQLSNPADAMQMVVGRRIVVKAKFQSAEEHRDAPFNAFFLIAENAELVSGDPPDRSAPPALAFTSYMTCQPQELDALASRLGSDLCVQSTLVADLAVTGPALEAAARAPMNVSPADTVSGDSNAITCRPDLEHSGLHLRAIACARNSYWAWYKAKWRDRSFLMPAPP